MGECPLCGSDNPLIPDNSSPPQFIGEYDPDGKLECPRESIFTNSENGRVWEKTSNSKEWKRIG